LFFYHPMGCICYVQVKSNLNLIGKQWINEWELTQTPYFHLFWIKEQKSILGEEAELKKKKSEGVVNKRVRWRRRRRIENFRCFSLSTNIFLFTVSYESDNLTYFRYYFLFFYFLLSDRVNCDIIIITRKNIFSNDIYDERNKKS